MATWTKLNQSLSNWASTNKTLTNSFLLLENGGYLLLENGNKIILEQPIASGTSWTQTNQSTPPTWTKLNQS